MIMEKNRVKKVITIHAPASEVWKALTDKELVKKYFFGTNVESDWKTGSRITYSGVWKGKKYEEEGEILDIEENMLLRHTFPKSMAGGQGQRPAYYTVSYELKPVNAEETELSVTQDGSLSESSAEQSGENWEQVLNGLKEVVETEFSHAH
jgi:uncharacterized protein YndB with AHSA1/START domain